MNCSQAMQKVLEGCIPGIRGPGCARIDMEDGRSYTVVGHGGMVERYSDEGELLEHLPATEITGEVADIAWRVDELGGIYCD